MNIKGKIVKVFRSIFKRSKTEEEVTKFLLSARDRDGKILSGINFETVDSMKDAVRWTRKIFAEDGDHRCDRVDVHSMGTDVGYVCSFGRTRLMEHFKKLGWRVSIYTSGIIKIDAAYPVDSGQGVL